MKAPTLRDVARLAGVSTTTASDALGGTGRIAPATRLRIAEIADDIGYTGNVAARRLRRAKTSVIGLYLQTQATELDYFKVLVMSAFHAVNRAGYDLILLGPRDLSSRTLASRVDGVLISDPFHGGDPDMGRLFGSNIPIVTIEEPDAALPPVAGVVTSDHRAVVREMLDTFRQGGARRPAFLMTDSSWSSQWAFDVVSAYEEWCREHDLTPVKAEVALPAEVAEIDSTVNALFESCPEIDALFCARDGLIARVSGLLRERGRRIGRDIALASGDDVPMLPYFYPPIAAIDLDPAGYAEQAVELLVDILEGRERLGARRMHEVYFRDRASAWLQGEEPSPRSSSA